ncbi:hypothetical protein [Streptomyces xanthophaeus]|uniref:hypothetical protein n=1 Tax=Streptomyces xanthophaeus TaxID=67385 RepID=UPI0037108B67
MAMRITIDIFSGRPNPTWEISGPDRLRELRERLSRNPRAHGAVGSGYTGLGFNGIRVDFTEGDAPAGLPATSELAGGGAKDAVASAELAQSLVETIPRDLSEGGGIAVRDTSYAQTVMETACDEIQRNLVEGPGGGGGAHTAHKAREETELPEGWAQQMRALTERIPTCEFDSYPWPQSYAYWDHHTVRPYNNCYCYAVNYRSDTEAWPGKAHGYNIPSSTMYGYQVAVGLYKDGLTQWGYPCQPWGTRRYLLVLCTGTWPVTGLRDFHFYRYHVEGYWSHKRSVNSPRITDESGYVIRDPGVCDKAHYTEVYPYFFQSHDSVRIA